MLYAGGESECETVDPDMILEWDDDPTVEIPKETMRELIERTRRKVGFLIPRKTA